MSGSSTPINTISKPHAGVTTMGTATMQHSRRSEEFWSGVRQELPLIVGVAPFGLVYGVLGVASGLSELQTILLSSILFAGASQVVFVQLLANGTPLPILVTSVSVVNLRHSLYSASVASHLRKLPRKWRILLAYLLTDEAYAVSINRFQNGVPSPNQHYHLLGTGITLWASWQVSTVVGVYFGTTIPDVWSLDFVIPLTFIALVAPLLKGKPEIIACLSAGFVSIFAQPLPWKIWIIMAALTGIVLGYASTIYRKGGGSS